MTNSHITAESADAEMRDGFSEALKLTEEAMSDTSPAPRGEGIVHRTTKQDVDNLFFSLYSEWLMDQPEAQITGGDKLIERMEQCWRLEDFLRQLPDQLEAEVRVHLAAK